MIIPKKTLLLPPEIQKQMEVSKKDLFRHALTYGAYTGAAMLVAAVITELVTRQLSFGGFLTYLLLSAGILFGQKAWFRNNEQATILPLTAHGIICGFGASLIMALYIVIDLKFVNTSAFDTAVEQSMQMLRESHSFTEQDLTTAATILDTCKIPFAIITYMIYNIVISLLFSLFSAWLIQIQKK